MSAAGTGAPAAPAPAAAPEAAGRFALAVGGLAILAGAVRLPRPGPLGPEEVMAVARAVRFAERGALGPGAWDGPWLGPLLAWPAVAALGPTRLALALPGALAAALAVALLAVAARRLLGGGAAPLVAAGLLALDPVAADAARRGRPEALAAALLVAALACALAWRDGRRLGWLAATGAALGLAAAASGAALVPAAALWLAFAGPALWRAWEGAPGAWAEAGLQTAGLVAVPAAAALLTLAPWFAAGHGVAEVLDLLEAVAAAASASLTAPAAAHGALTAPATWFLAPLDTGAVLPNPLSWLLALPALAWLTSQALARPAGWAGTRDAWLAPLLAAAGYLPLLAVERPAPLAAALPALPFLFVAVAGGVAAFSARRGVRWLPAGYLAAVAAVAGPLLWRALG